MEVCEKEDNSVGGTNREIERGGPTLPFPIESP